MSALAASEIRASVNEARLAEHAALLENWLARGRRVPILWGTEGFAHSVELVRTHLRPLASLESLGFSYGREHFHSVAVDSPPSSPLLMSRNATEVAYALRWLELRDERPRAAWHDLISAIQG